MSSPGYPKYVIKYMPDFNLGVKHNGSIWNDVYPGNDWSEFLDRDLAASPPGWRSTHPLPINPYWNRNVKKTSSYVTSRYWVTSGYGADVMDVKSWNKVYSFYGGRDPSGDVETAPEIFNILNNMLMDRAQDQKINLAQFIAERRQLVNMVTSTATRLAHAITALKRGNPKRAWRTLTGTGRVHPFPPKVRGGIANVASDWLAMQYGWKPLLSDLYGGLETFANMCETYRPPVLRVSAKATARSDDIVEERDGAVTEPKIKWTGHNGLTHGKAFAEFRLSSEFGTYLGSTGVINIYDVAWEIVPYSFVVDWFIPVGDYLRRLTYDTGLVFSRGAYSLKSEREWTCVVLEKPKGFFMDGSSQTWVQFDPGKAVTSHAFSFKRVPMLSMPLPTLPQFKDNFSPTKALNAIALMATSFGRDPGHFRPR
jgi:hypothetical protein